MHLAVDIREACKEKRAGKGQWTYGFVEELLKRDVSLTLLTDSPIPDSWDEKPTTRILKLARGFRWHFRAYRFLKNNKEIDAYVSTTSYIVPFLLRSKMPVAQIVHDLIAFRKEPHNRKAKMIEKSMLPTIIKSVKHVCTVSESTKSDLIKRFKGLKANNVTSVFAGPMREKVSENYPDGKTILCIATLCPRKNQLRLIRAYQSLPDELRLQYQLKLVGSRGWNDDEIIKEAEKTVGVEWRDYVDDNEYSRLMKACTVFALPSLYEGFGMQILDALQRGIPVLTSDRGSLKEVAGDAAKLVDPESIGSITYGLTELLENAELRQDLAKKGPRHAEQFSWKRTVDLFLEAMDKMVG